MGLASVVAVFLVCAHVLGSTEDELQTLKNSGRMQYEADEFEYDLLFVARNTTPSPFESAADPSRTSADSNARTATK
jgi:hypothetical protein